MSNKKTFGTVHGPDALSLGRWFTLSWVLREKTVSKAVPEHIQIFNRVITPLGYLLKSFYEARLLKKIQFYDRLLAL